MCISYEFARPYYKTSTIPTFAESTGLWVIRYKNMHADSSVRLRYESLSVVSLMILVATHYVVATGLDAAGKTTMLYKLKLGEVVTTIPTIGIVTAYSLFH